MPFLLPEEFMREFVLGKRLSKCQHMSKWRKDTGSI